MVKLLQRIKTPLTLLVLLGIVIFGAVWGWKALTTPISEGSSSPCVMITIGPKLYPAQVTVRVYNGGSVAGLAASQADELRSRGFRVIKTTNTSVEVTSTRVVGFSQNSPEVQLVAAQFKDVTVLADQRADHSVDVYVGNTFGGVVDGATNQIATTSNTMCLPRGTPEVSADSLPTTVATATATTRPNKVPAAARPAASASTRPTPATSSKAVKTSITPVSATTTESEGA